MTLDDLSGHTNKKMRLPIVDILEKNISQKKKILKF